MIRSNDFQVFIKPVGARCNLGCTYCYYLDKGHLYPAGGTRMTDEVLEKCIRAHFETGSRTVLFSWHGGEPLLAGIEFYRRAVILQKKFAPGNVLVLNGIQTNGTLLNREWCEFLAAEKFIVGISIDGPEHLHNLNRRSINGLPSFDKVIEGFRLLKEYGVTAEVLCVINSLNVKYPLEVYEFFREQGAESITFLPLVERDPCAEAGVTSRSVPAEQFGIFLSAIFDEWTAKDIGNIKVQIFEEALRTAFNQEHTLCIFKKYCGGVPVLEHNGDFYACDHYVNPEYLAGNIAKKALADLLSSDSQVAFGRNKSLLLPDYCRRCEVLSMCNGECPRNRFITTPDGEEGLNYLCAGYKYFFNHCVPFIEAVRQVWQANKAKS